MTPKIKIALLHFGKLIALGAGIAFIAGVIALLSGLNLAVIVPPALVGVVTMLAPLVVSVLSRAETELEAQLAAEQSAATVQALTTQLTVEKAKVVSLTEKSTKPAK